MANFSPLWIGTLVFIIAGVLFCASGQVFRLMGKLSSGEAKLMNLFVLVAGVSMWMMWAMTWLSQVNPILYPLVHNPQYQEAK